MSNSPHLAPATINTWLEVDGGGLEGKRIPLVQVDTTWTVNRPAEAGLTLALGYNPRQRKGLRRSPAHDLIAMAEQGIPVRVMVRARGTLLVDDQGRRLEWPTQDIVVFRGETRGSGFQEFRGRQHHMITAVHWIKELDRGSLVSDLFARGSIGHLLVRMGSDGGLMTSGELMAAANRASDNADGSIDLYRQGLLPMLERLMDDENLGASDGYKNLISKINQIAPGSSVSSVYDGEGNLTAGNDRALEILRSINSSDNNQIVRGNLNMPLVEDPGTRQNILESMASAISSNTGTFSAMRALVQMGQHFKFHLVSNVEAAALVPLLPAVRKEHIWRTIPASQLLSARGRRADASKLSAVFLISQGDPDAGATTRGESGLTGAFVGRNEGEIQVSRAPGFVELGNLRPDELKAFSDGTHPDDDQLEEFDTTRRNMLVIGSLWAQLAWADRAFRGRTMSVTCPYRLDIAPGSMLALPGLRYRGDDIESDNGTLYGAASSVRTIIDATKPSAVTQLTMTHVRGSGEEAQVPATHPLYGETWPGSPLVKLRDSDLEPQT